ncbi:MAG TPA: 4-hydroxy-3-methylbut-2-enyl diphosphate reductase, partial [Candidatus Goldiibacteriota bacterium]|nr:4-hydroxy-3-methylbut-2-enyl diphosphate reductase [Candidatus Goldiibacteriota bacterium]
STVIVSAHGISPEEETELLAKKIDILDTTCPYVKKIHMIVKQLVDDGYEVVIVGDKDHFEVKGILGYSKGRGIVVSCAEDIASARLGRKVGVVSQTTQNRVFFMEMVCEIMRRVFVVRQAEVRVFHTICDATELRQKSVEKLAAESDVMVVVGGKESANTKRLYEISKRMTKNTYHVESASELKEKWFRGKKSAGIAGGASTPDDVIMEVAEKIRTMSDRRKSRG